MKVDCELTQDEQDALCMLMGLGTGAALQLLRDLEMAKAGVRALNKILARSPDYIPYDENSYDPTVGAFPFKRNSVQ